MRPIYLVRLDKTRPALVLTRASMLSRLRWVTVAPITSTVRGLSVEVAVGPANGLDHSSVVNLDSVTSVSVDQLGRHLGFLLPDQEPGLADAIRMAFDLV